MPKAIAFYDREKRKDRVMAIRSSATKLNMAPVDVKQPDPIDAIAAIMSCKKGVKGKKVKPPALMGYMVDLHAPVDSGVSDEIWVECILCLLEQEGISFYPLDTRTGDKVDLASNVIRKYHKAFTCLTEALRCRLNTRLKKYGRPPYGYHMVKGELEVEPERAKAIRYIFERVRQGAIPKEVIDELKAKFGVMPGDTKPQFWDHIKLRRIVKRSRLYCLGEYQASDGTKMTISKLAFLPPEWVDTIWPTHQGVTP